MIDYYRDTTRMSPSVPFSSLLTIYALQAIDAWDAP